VPRWKLRRDAPIGSKDLLGTEHADQSLNQTHQPNPSQSYFSLATSPLDPTPLSSLAAGLHPRSVHDLHARRPGRRRSGADHEPPVATAARLLPSMARPCRPATRSSQGNGFDILLLLSSIAHLPGSSPLLLNAAGVVHCYGEDGDSTISSVSVSTSREAATAMTPTQRSSFPPPSHTSSITTSLHRNLLLLPHLLLCVTSGVERIPVLLFCAAPANAYNNMKIPDAANPLAHRHKPHGRGGSSRATAIYMRRAGREEAETRLLWIEYDISVKTSDSSYSTSTNSCLHSESTAPRLCSWHRVQIVKYPLVSFS
jgi:hypothetical protein